MSHVICVHSYKGGTGKTLIAINLAFQLSKTNRILLIEADFLMPCFFQIFPNEEISSYYNDFYEGDRRLLRDCIESSPFSNLDLVYVSPDYDPKFFSKGHNYHLNKLKVFLNQLGALNYDFIILDSAPGRNFVSIGNLVIAHLALVVVRPTNYSVMGTKIMLGDVYEKIKPPKMLPTFIIFNQVPLPNSIRIKSQMKEWTRILIDTQRVTESFMIPFNEETALEAALGKSVFTKGLFSEKIEEIKVQIIEYFEKLI
ncbi:MAG: ParA family protein [Promethearchaeota archaeon]